MQASRGVYICASITVQIGYSIFDGSARYAETHAWLTNIDEQDGKYYWAHSFQFATLYGADEASKIIATIKTMPEYNVMVSNCHFHTEAEMASAAEMPDNIRELLKL